MTASVVTSSHRRTRRARPASATPTWRAGAAAGLAAAAATTAVAATARHFGVSFETAPGEAIPLLGFAQLTLVFTAVGIVIARAMARRARRPRSTFVRTTVVLTALSLVPDVLLHAGPATTLSLVATHLVAAAIVIPVLSAPLAPSPHAA